MEAHLHEQFKLWSFVVLCQSQSRMQGGKREESNMKKFKRMETVGHILSTSRSPFHAYYISFPSSGSQESNSSNGVQIGVETMKLWPFVDNRAKLSELSCENFAGCFAAAKPPLGPRVPFRSCEMWFMPNWCLSWFVSSWCSLIAGLINKIYNLLHHILG